MVSSNKILTVSYGTFSCTLEGFDDSFNTMKAIAEYFRDLAQDDRYFGAEPPTPDAEMLARIAEREIERRVEARFDKGNLVLRPTDDAETPQGDVATEKSSGAALAGATAGLAATGLAVAGPADEPETDTDDDMVTADEEAVAEANADDMDTDVVTLDLSETDLGDAEESAVSDVAIDLPEAAEEDETPDALSLAETAEDDFDIDTLIGEQETAEEDSAADLPQPTAEVVEVEEVDADIVHPSADTTDSVAEKLQRIRAVVASKAQEEPDYIEDEHAMSGPDGDGVDENDALDLAGDLPGFDDDPEPAALSEEDASTAYDDESDNLFADTIAAMIDDEVATDADHAQEDVAEEADQEDTKSDAEAELEALRAKVAELEAQARAAAKSTEDSVDVAPATEAEESNADDADEDDAPAEDTGPLVLENAQFDDDDTAESKPLVARVGKAKRADVEAALAAGAIEAYEDEDVPSAESTAEPLPGADDSSLTPEQEAELARELAELQAEIDEDDDWNIDVSEAAIAKDAPTEDDQDSETAEEAEANIRKAVKLTSPARAMLTDTSIEEDDTSVERLIDQTETEMDEPEGNRRRSAIAHLRAAVAATNADRLLGFGKKEEDEEEPYREDLADAVRPRRPKVTEARSERPAPVRPAPLKLVAEQRVDVEDAPKDITPVRPRRIMRADPVETTEDLAADDQGFAEFAESQGAHTLPELLEAAAAYMSFVEGRDQFSRPQLMTKLHQAEGETSSREDRLRSFGQLLRDGKIEKKGGGRFAASDNIGFKPDERAAG